jgi:hypothetical protein
MHAYPVSTDHLSQWATSAVLDPVLDVSTVCMFVHVCIRVFLCVWCARVCTCTWEHVYIQRLEVNVGVALGLGHLFFLSQGFLTAYKGVMEL